MLTMPNLADGTLREPDEMDRADARAADIGFESWNQVSANRYKAAHPAKTKTTTPTDTSTPPGPPKTQPGNDGAPPKVPRSPVASPGHPDDNGCGCGARYLYRGLGPHDDPTKGIYPRNIGNHESVFRHVRFGSKSWWPGDQFISLTTQESIAYSFSSRVITVDPSKIVGNIIDLTTPEGRLSAGLTPGQPAWNYAASKWEVLIEEGYIPPEAIIHDTGASGDAQC
jgi:hypothetical protein